MGYGADQITDMLLYQDILSVITRVLSFLISIVNFTVILVMFIKCGRFRRTRVYEHYNGIKTLSKALEIIVILLVIEAVYGLTRIFSIIDAVNLIKSFIPDFPDVITAYLIFVTSVLPIINCAVSIFAWSYYQGTRRLFFSVYPNGVQKVDFAGRQAAYMPNDNIFGSSSEANLNYGPNNTSVNTAPMSNQPNAVNQTAFNPTNNAYPQPGRNFGAPPPSAQNNDDFFGTGVSDDYINRLTDVDQAKLEELLVQDTPETEYKVTPATNDNTEGDIFGTGSNLWQAVPDMSDPLISEILVTEEAPKEEVYQDGQNSVFGSGTTEDYMKRFTTADDDVISELIVQDEPEEK